MNILGWIKIQCAKINYMILLCFINLFLAISMYFLSEFSIHLQNITQQ